jgi:hypothetical protein
MGVCEPVWEFDPVLLLYVPDVVVVPCCVELVVCALALKDMPATSMIPITTSFFILAGLSIVLVV